MSPAIYKAFEKICSQYNPNGPVLEVGSVPGSDSLLTLPCFEGCIKKIGISLEYKSNYADSEIIQGNANEMTMFDSNYFEVVVCNSTLEHDPFFWKTIDEIHRVVKPGGLIVIGVPGYVGMGFDYLARPKSILWYFLKFFSRINKDNVLQASTITLGEHFFPGDYYRFTEQAVREIFLKNLEEIKVEKVMSPPRFIGYGKKRNGNE